jgi:hypothetical protein
MNRFRALVFFLTVVLPLAFSISVAPTACAQTSPATTTATTAPRLYDAAKETAVSGTISEVVTRPKAGLRLGLHLMVETAQGRMDVQLGPYFARIAAQKGLLPGATIQVTGETFHYATGDVFLARTITVGNQTITVRNRYGFPVRPVPAGKRIVRGTQQTGGQ